MDATYRQPTSDLVNDVIDNAPSYSFFRATEILLEELGHAIEERSFFRQAPEGLFFLVNPSLAFPSSDVQKVEQFGEDHMAMTVNFLGLHGASSPLPTHMVEATLQNRGDEGVQEAFQNFFSNRMIWFFYLIWRKYRYHIRYQENAGDQFSNWMFSLIGIGSEEIRQTSDIPWAKLLTYLGVISARTRSADLVDGVIAHAFELERVTIEEFVVRRVDIPEHQRVKLGVMNSTLGSDLTIGKTSRDAAGKFVIDIWDLDFETFRSFLPSGHNYGRLRDLVQFLLRDQLAFDVRLNLAEGQTPQFVIGDENNSHLGWTTFAGEVEKNGPQRVQLTVAS